MNGKATPPASDIDEAVTWVKVQLVADEIELIVLCSFEPPRLTTETGRGIKKRWTEPWFIELDGKIVVMSDGRSISSSRMFCSSCQQTDQGEAIVVELGQNASLLAHAAG